MTLTLPLTLSSRIKFLPVISLMNLARTGRSTSWKFIVMSPWPVATGRSAGTPDGAAADGAAATAGAATAAGLSVSEAAVVAESSPSEASLSSAAWTPAAMTHRQIAIASARAQIRPIAVYPRKSDVACESSYPSSPLQPRHDCKSMNASRVLIWHVVAHSLPIHMNKTFHKTRMHAQIFIVGAQARAIIQPCASNIV